MKYSKQRELILEYVKSVKTHPTAETVYSSLRENNPNLSLGTVYRNLDKLAQANNILRLKFANGNDRFDGNIKHHYHGICIKCGDVLDIFTDYFSYIDTIVENSINCKILSHDVVFNTICPTCQEKL